MNFGHVSTASKDAIGLMFSGLGIYISLILASRVPNVGAINQFFNALVAAAVGVGSVAAAVTIAWQKVLTTSRGIRADLKETKENVERTQATAAENNARIAALEKEAVVLREKAQSADVRVHTAHKLARDAMNLSRDEVAAIKAEAAVEKAKAEAEIAALKKDLAQFHDRYHDTVKVVNKLNLESEVREREAIRSNDPDKEPAKGPGPGVTADVLIAKIKKLADLDVLDSAHEMPTVGPEKKIQEGDKPGGPGSAR
jgi:cell division septum initiation protein DivIVA